MEKFIETKIEDRFPDILRGRFEIDFNKAITNFEHLMQKIKVKNILYRTIMRGRGLEFDAYREYGPDDDATLIDWSASLRADQLLTKVYIEERNLNVYFLVDVGSSMLFGSNDKLKAEYQAEIVAAIFYLILKAGDSAGITMFSDRISKFLYPSNKRTHLGLMQKFLSGPKLYGGGFDLNKAIKYSLKSARSSFSVFIILSDFVNAGSHNEKALRILSSQFETMAVMIRDPMDQDLPNTSYQFVLQDPNSSKQLVMDPSIARKRFSDIARKRKAAVKEMLRRANIDMIELDINKSFITPMAGFLMSRVGKLI